jgi:hypothetical protein
VVEGKEVVVINTVAAGAPFVNVKITFVPIALSPATEATRELDEPPTKAGVAGDCKGGCSNVLALESSASRGEGKTEGTLDNAVVD